MSQSFLTNLNVVGYVDLNKNELRNAAVQNLGTAPSSPVIGQVYFNTGSNTLQVWTGAAWVTWYPSTTPLQNITQPTAAVSANSQKITNLATPVASSDASTRGYVDTSINALTLDSINPPVADVAMAGYKLTNLGAPVNPNDAVRLSDLQGSVAGISWKNPVRVIAVANGAIATAFAAGQVVDGVTLATGDRILLAGQTTASQNGIYVVTSGTPTRATDADSGTELQGAAMFVQQGTTYADTSWTQTTDGTITVGTTSLVFVQFGANSLQFSGGLTKTGNTVTANVDGTALQVVSNQLTIVPGYVARKYVGTLTGNASTTSFTLTHGLNSKDVQVCVRATSGTLTDQPVGTDLTYTSTSQVTIGFSTAPASGATFSVSVIG